MTSCKPPPTCIDASPIPDANDSRMSAIPYEANLTPMGVPPLGSSKSAGGPAGEGQSIGDAARSKVQDHYASEGMASRILAALRAARDGEVGPITPNALASRDHLRGRELKCSP